MNFIKKQIFICYCWRFGLDWSLLRNGRSTYLWVYSKTKGHLPCRVLFWPSCRFECQNYQYVTNDTFCLTLINITCLLTYCSFYSQSQTVLQTADNNLISIT